MNDFRTDLHIHTVLSPCGDLEMSPGNIIREAVRKGLDIIGVTDHNTTRHCRLMVELGKEAGIVVLPGAEVNTAEEVHCLAFFENLYQADAFQEFLDRILPDAKNSPDIFGDQVQVDRNELILYEEEKLLFSALQCNLEQMEKKVRELEGLFIPSHIDRPANSILGQLGFLPPDLQVDALEISGDTDETKFRKLHPELVKYQLLKSSDAHFIEDVGKKAVVMKLERPSFSEVRMAIQGISGREVKLL